MRYALDGIRRRPGRSALAGLGIGLATALVIALLALSAGISDSADRLAVESGVDLLATSENTTIVSGTFPPLDGAHSVPSGFARADPNVASASPWLVEDLVYANASLFERVHASSNGSAVPPGWAPTGAGSVGWIPGDNAGLETPTVGVGPGFSSPSDPHYGNGSFDGPALHEVVLDQGLATLLDVGPGAVVWASPRSPADAAQLGGWFANATAFTVVGISGPFWLIPSALLGFFELSELQTLLGGPVVAHDEASVVLVHLADPSSASSDRAILAQAFPQLTVLTLSSLLGAINSVVDLYRTFGTLVGLIAIGVAALFVASALLMSVDDRAQEIALLRAIGYRRAAIAGFVLEEAALLSGLGLALGVPLGLGLSYGLNDALAGLVSGLPAGFRFIAFDPTVAAGALAEIALIGLAAAVLPVVRAVRLPIAPELRAP